MNKKGSNSGGEMIDALPIHGQTTAIDEGIYSIHCITTNVLEQSQHL